MSRMSFTIQDATADAPPKYNHVDVEMSVDDLDWMREQQDAGVLARIDTIYDQLEYDFTLSSRQRESLESELITINKQFIKNYLKLMNSGAAQAHRKTFTVTLTVQFIAEVDGWLVHGYPSLIEEMMGR